MEDSLENTVKKENTCLNRLSYVGLGIVVFGEFGLQLLALSDVIPYTWFTGHLSDFGISMQLTSYTMQATKNKKKYIQALAATMPATICTLHEFFPISPSEKHFDVQDIGLYWLAAGLTYGVAKTSLSNRIRLFVSKINPLYYFRKNSL